MIKKLIEEVERVEEAGISRPEMKDLENIIDKHFVIALKAINRDVDRKKFSKNIKPMLDKELGIAMDKMMAAVR